MPAVSSAGYLTRLPPALAVFPDQHFIQVDARIVHVWSVPTSAHKSGVLKQQSRRLVHFRRLDELDLGLCTRCYASLVSINIDRACRLNRNGLIVTLGTLSL